MHTLVWQGIPKSEDTKEQNFIYFWPYSDLGSGTSSGSEVVLHRVYGTGEGGRRRSVQRRQRDQRFFLPSPPPSSLRLLSFLPREGGDIPLQHILSSFLCTVAKDAYSPSPPPVPSSLSLFSSSYIRFRSPSFLGGRSRSERQLFFALRAKEAGLRFTDRAN